MKRLYNSIKGSSPKRFKNRSSSPHSPEYDSEKEPPFSTSKFEFIRRLSGKWNHKNTVIQPDYSFPSKYREPSFGSTEYLEFSGFFDPVRSINTVSEYRSSKPPFYFTLLNFPQNSNKRTVLHSSLKSSIKLEPDIKSKLVQKWEDPDAFSKSFLRDVRNTFTTNYTKK